MFAPSRPTESDIVLTSDVLLAQAISVSIDESHGLHTVHFSLAQSRIWLGCCCDRMLYFRKQAGLYGSGWGYQYPT